MKILFDHQVFSWQRYGGISRYFAELIRGLRAAGEEAVLPADFYAQNIHLQELTGETQQPISPQNFPGKNYLQNLLGREKSEYALRTQAPQVFHPTYFDPYFLPQAERRRVPFVITVHDMIHEKFGHGSRWFSIDSLVVPGKKLLAERAAAIVAVSESTRADLLEIYPHLPPEKIQVIHHGSSLVADSSAKFQLDLPEQFLLYVGNRNGYKNFGFMVRELAGLLLANPNLKLLCAGSQPFSSGELALFNSLKINEQCLHLPFKTDAELTEIYRRARCFIFPSRYEGFGIPVLESFAAGCPAVLHSIPALREVGGDSALYFSENEPGSLAAQVQKLLGNAIFRGLLAGGGAVRLADFSWKKSVAEHLELYRTVAQMFPKY